MAVTEGMTPARLNQTTQTTSGESALAAILATFHLEDRCGYERSRQFKTVGCDLPPPWPNTRPRQSH